MFFFIDADLESLTPFINSTLHNASIKRCLSRPRLQLASDIFDTPCSIVSWIEIRSRKSAGMYIGVSRCSSSIVWCARYAHALIFFARTLYFV